MYMNPEHFSIEDPPRICVHCGLWFKTSAFATTLSGRPKRNCNSCLEKKKEARKKEAENYHKYINAVRRYNQNKQMEKIDSIEIKITSSNKNIDLSKLNSFTLNFDQ